MKKLDWLLISAILIIAFSLRLFKLDRPIGDWHSWRQADTASVTRKYVQNGINFLLPTYDDLSSIPSGLDNPQGYRMVEFPMINAITAFLFNLFAPNITLEYFSRLVSAIFSLGSVLIIYWLMVTLVSRPSAVFSALTFAVLPYNLFYSTAILPEVPLVFFSLLSTLLWVKHSLSPHLKFLIPFMLSLSLSLLLKPTVLFLVPAWAYLYLRSQHTKKLTVSVFIPLLAFIPLLLWRQWIGQYPEGIPAYTWLLNSTKIRFTGAFFRWIFAERFGKLILGYWGVFLLGLGLISQPVKIVGWFFHLWALGLLLYIFIFATGNVTHDYYQIITIPIIAVFVGLGISLLSSPPRAFARTSSLILLGTSFIFMFAFSWYHIRDFYNINNPAMISAGLWVDAHTPSNSLVIAPYGGDTAFLYQTHRSGWPIGGDIQHKIDLGATHYLSLTYDDETRELEKSCQLLEHNDSFTLISLQGCSFDQVK